MNIIITGASRGIGFETALHLAGKDDVNLVLISRNEDKLKMLLDACGSVNPKASVNIIPFDLNSLMDDDENLRGKIKELMPKVDVLINNAGYLYNSNFQSFPTTEAQQIFNVNFFKPALLIRQLLPLLLKSESSHVLNISSMGGFQGSAKFPGLSYYSASKAAIANLTECLAEEYKETGVSFNCLALGAVQTEMLNEAFPGYKAPIRAHEMAEYIAKFALEGNKFFNGKVLPVALSTP